MAQNSQRLQWTETEVDEKLKNIMLDCYNICYATGKKYGKDGQSELPRSLSSAPLAGS